MCVYIYIYIIYLFVYMCAIGLPSLPGQRAPALMLTTNSI